MTIQLHNAGKRYNRDWIFRNLNYTFQLGKHYAITGPNGSGKSTLLQVLSGAVSINEGSCSHALNNAPIAPEKIFNYASLCAPYLELVEEFTLTEFLTFHQSFKPFVNGMSVTAVIEAVHLPHARHKKINEYSSGMKQRVKLAQCILSDTPLVLLDEPCTNLDVAGIELYNQLIKTYCSGRLAVVSSNDIAEYGFCEEVLDITAFK
ncbi:ABC transporter ATP-binding protein [Niabella hibiscisoli]|uniref:ABC transporter ATP-binding protein n=1 Tax=Niabella hibiscisoli TaxID=1825928 RepID=UPI001F10852F|nr:ATP-binding cassette domain-containing protein [Niabella hibiscisoli]MCH5715500.1 ATP-binding cassette domain-containing protein [Niabella hibiscisoli]